MKIPPKIDQALFDSPEFADKAITAAAGRAEELVAFGDSELPQTLDEITEGAAFIIDVLAPEGVETGDGRTFASGALTVADFPLPLSWQIISDQGHKQSVLVARIDSAEQLFNEDGSSAGWGKARGVFDTGAYGREAERLVRNKFLRGVSVDLDKFTASAQREVFSEDTDPNVETITAEKINVEEARIRAATLVTIPAFQECTIRLLEEEAEFAEIEDGVYTEDSDDLEDAYAALTASAAPVVPPRAWFQNPRLKSPTPLTVDDDGRVYGHIAAWSTSHIGMAGKVKPPHSSSDYKYFRTGVVRTDDGTDVTVGQLTLSGGHASTALSARDAIKHYDDTNSAIVDVNIGEDAHGIWVAGALRPDTTPSQVRTLRASAVSGDWRPIHGRLELVAACCVNVPGFPQARAMVAGGQITALVAAGARPLAELKSPVSVNELEERVRALELSLLETERAGVLDSFASVLDASDKVTEDEAAEARKYFGNLIEQGNAELSAEADNLKKQMGLL